MKVEWRVVNEAVEGGEDMLYGIGGHPAFTFPGEVKPVDCSLRIYGGTAAVNGNNISDNVATCRELRYHLLNTAGCIDMSQEYVLDMPESCARITENMFDKDALIVLDNQVNRIELLDAVGKAYVTMDCQGFPYLEYGRRRLMNLSVLSHGIALPMSQAVTEILKIRQECRGLQPGTAGSMRIRLPSKIYSF